ncbi:MAG: hypothetical protein PHN20_10040, partial [Bacteroidales bacterium]|nr:hypothetical protein [Bacteroidales bacterium]
PSTSFLDIYNPFQAQIWIHICKEFSFKFCCFSRKSFDVYDFFFTISQSDFKVGNVKYRSLLFSLFVDKARLELKLWLTGNLQYLMIFDYRKLFMGSKFALFNYATKQTGGYVDVDFFHYTHKP